MKQGWMAMYGWRRIYGEDGKQSEKQNPQEMQR